MEGAEDGVWRRTPFWDWRSWGGSIGAWAAMLPFHHKTLHNKFRFKVPVILILQLIVVAFVLSKVG